MSSNYPPGVSENTYGAPWNDISFGIAVEVKLEFSFTVPGPRSKADLDEVKQEYIKEVMAKIKDLDCEYKIRDINVEDY